MAKLILTGKHEAIDLKALRGEQVLKLDQKLVEESEDDVFWLVGIRGRALRFVRSLATTQFLPLTPPKKKPRQTA
jgi:hypothetical protein